MSGLEAGDFTGAEARPDSGEEAQREEWHGRRMVGFDELHQFLRLGRRERLRTAPAAANAMGWNLGQRILGNPVALLGEFEEPRNHAAAVVVGLARGAAEFEIRHQPGGRQIRHRDGRAALGQPVHLAAQAHEVRLGNQVLLKFVLLERDVVCDRLGDRFLTRRLAVIGQGVIDPEGERVRPAGQPPEDRLRLVQLVLRQPGDSRADAGCALKAPDFERVGFSLGLGVGGKVLPDALAVEPAGDAKNDLPGGIREF